jgi:hypothetical protein
VAADIVLVVVIVALLRLSWLLCDLLRLILLLRLMSFIVMASNDTADGTVTRRQQQHK